MALTLDRSGSFPRVATKRKTKVSVGFEWEVPADIEEPECTCCEEGYIDEDGNREEYCSYCCGEDGSRVDLNRVTKDFIETHGFRTHIECGGTEFASPVFGNITTARRVAGLLKGVALQDRALGPEVADYNACGIHVHTGHTDWNKGVGYEYSTDVESVYAQVVSMLNRKSSAAFVLEFSGRENGNTHYLTQAVSSCWDYTEGVTTPTREQLSYMRCMKMVRPNCFGRIGTVEYRLWDAAEDRLIPAIEFAHACTTFITRRKDIPYLKEFKLWLDRQSGYKVLKQDNAWRLL